TSNATSTVIKTTTGALIDIPNVANREIQLKTSNNHTFALTGDGKITVDGEEVVSKEIILNAVYPVGCTYITLTNVNPRTVLGVGTWEKIGQGLQLAIAGSAKDSNNTSHTFSAGANNGEWSHAITVKELPEHSHKVTCKENGNHTHARGSMNIKGTFDGNIDDGQSQKTGAFYYTGRPFQGSNGDGAASGGVIGFDASRSGAWTGETSENGNHNHTITIGDTGSDNKHNNITPSFAIYLWTRTA
ncbi:MAG: hypothetical protein IJ880_10805, partial [Bacilli bacterium]|nr:hypothetical protein [Bacilli bacterium]